MKNTKRSYEHLLDIMQVRLHLEVLTINIFILNFCIQAPEGHWIYDDQHGVAALL